MHLRTAATATFAALALSTGVLASSAQAASTGGDPSSTLETQTTNAGTESNFTGSGQLTILPDESKAGDKSRYAIDTGSDVVPVAATAGMEDAVGRDVQMRRGDITSSSPRAATSGAGTRKVLGILVAYSDQASRPFTSAQLKSNLDGAGTSASNFFSAQSGGAAVLNATVVPQWVGLTQPMATTCQDTNFTDQALAGARAQGYDPDQYDHVVMVTNTRRSSCPEAGLATINGGRVWTYGSVDTGILTHELGHNFGAQHATSLSCRSGSAPVAFSSSCTSSEYGDPTDVMGNAYNKRLMSTFHRLEVGHLVGSAKVVKTSETVTLNNATTAGQTLARIPRRIAGQPTRDFWALELRGSTSPFDSFGTADPNVTGVTIRLSGKPGSGSTTGLIDTHPSSSTFGDAALQPGETFNDTATGIAIRVDSVVDGTATVSVTQPVSIDSTAPPVPDYVIGQRADDGLAELSWYDANDDETDAPRMRYELRRDGVLLQTVTGEASQSGEYAYQHAARFSDDGLEHDYSVLAIDEAGNRSPEVTAEVAATPDTVAPGNPTNLRASQTGGQMTLSWDASPDNRGIRYYRVGSDADGFLGETTSTSLKFDARRVGTDTYRVTAFDPSFNESQAGILQFTVQPFPGIPGFVSPGGTSGTPAVTPPGGSSGSTGSTGGSGAGTTTPPGSGSSTGSTGGSGSGSTTTVSKPTLKLKTPTLKKGKAKLSASRKLSFSVTGSKVVVSIKVGSKKAVRAASIKLTRAQAARSSVVVTAKDGKGNTVTLKLSIRKRVVRVK